MKLTEHPIITRELSWLDFNARVLQESESSDVPLIERLRFLGIFSNNLDEFYRVRYANARRGVQLKSTKHPPEYYSNLIQDINDKVHHLNKIYENTYQKIAKSLSKEGLTIVQNESDFSHPTHIAFIREYYQSEIESLLPIYVMNPSVPFPEIKDDTFYLLVNLSKKGSSDNTYMVVEAPVHHLSRFVLLPKIDNARYIAYLEDIIRYCLPETLRNHFEFDKIAIHAFKITRDSELSYDHDLSKSFLEEVNASLKSRKHSSAVRLVHDGAISKKSIQFLQQVLHLNKLDSIIATGRYLNKRDLISFPDYKTKKLVYRPYSPLPISYVNDHQNILDQILAKDILVHAPYTSFNYILRFLRAAALDADVVSVKMTIYRLAKHSKIVEALLMAAKNGKKVSVVLELTARFDEEANVNWTHTLEQEGIEVIHGTPGLKTHAKLIHISQVKQGKKLHYSCVGTGNFNEKTAKIYTDYWLLTAHKDITRDVNQIFKFHEANYLTPNLKRLHISPFNNRELITELIDNEIEFAKQGNKASLKFKFNTLSDPSLIAKLYEASQANVKIKLIVRGACSLIPGMKDVSDNIQVISIIDRFLEHTRLFIANNGGEPRIYISSADIMTRNLNRRVEASCPILDPDIQEELQDNFKILWRDNVKARIIDQDDTNTFRQPAKQDKQHRAQVELFRYYQGKL